MSFRYLKPQSYYEDLYDLHTIDQCLYQVKMLREVGQKMKSDPKIKLPESEVDRNGNLYLARLLFVIKAHRYKDKAKTVSEWMEKDRARQNKQDDTPPPEFDCPDCETKMEADDFRHLEDWPEDKPMRVLFILNCPKCKKREGVYDSGEVHVSKPQLCPKCGKEVKTTYKFKKNITTTTRCTSCKYKEVDIDDHAKSKAKREAEEKADAELLAKYRSEFCLSDKEGNEYIQLLEAMDVAHEVYQETIAEIDIPAQEKLMSVEKTPISALEPLLNKAMKKSGFIKLSFGDPEINRYVNISFTVQDRNSKRHQNESISDLSDLLKETLKDTNWRVARSDLSYRLGFISGKLKGYESDVDLLKLFRKQEPKKPESKLDPKLREKYAHHNYVQLARMNGEFQAKQQIRKRRLKDEPEGFFYERGESGYTCGICRRSQYSEDIWWREDGLRCRDCWRNIQEGVIPILDLRKEWWEKEFLTRFDVTYHHGVHASSIKRLIREGELVGRELKEVGGNIYCTIFLTSENSDFIEKYPRKINEK